MVRGRQSPPKTPNDSVEYPLFSLIFWRRDRPQVGIEERSKTGKIDENGQPSYGIAKFCMEETVGWDLPQGRILIANDWVVNRSTQTLPSPARKIEGGLNVQSGFGKPGRGNLSGSSQRILKETRR